MSDFIFSSIIQPRLQLTYNIESIYHNDKPEIAEFHGEWGSLAVSRNRYSGLQPIETDKYIFVVIGGPVLTYTNNDFLLGDDPTLGTRKIFERWNNGSMNWSDDLDGPFAIFVLDKVHNRIVCITDLMMYIPVYKFISGNTLIIGTHIDILAKVSGHEQNIDLISAVDFILNDETTFPYTAYNDLQQCQPASVHEFFQKEIITERVDTYWLPIEENTFKNIDEAALQLRCGLQEHVHRITMGMDRVAQFMSGGEDSRALAGLIPEEIDRDAFIFLDHMNREGHIAKKAAAAYGANFNVGYRNQTYYLDILSEAADLIGNGHQYTHAHSIGFVDNFRLHSYPAVFGGFFSDAILKAGSRKTWLNTRYFFLPQFSIIEETKTETNMNSLFKSDIINEVTERRRKHMNTIKAIRPTSSYDWFEFWPATMCDAITSLYTNRRLFRSYEPFMCNKVVKIGAAVPLKWKLNRSLFHKAMKPMLKKSKWIVHSDGRLPYYSWKINFFVGCFNWAVSGIARRLKKNNIINEGPWGNLQDLISHQKWNTITDLYKETAVSFDKLVATVDHSSFFDCNRLKVTQQINLLQVLYTLNSKGNCNDSI